MGAEFATTPKRVLMTADTVGGVWNYALELARALAPYGVEVALAAMGLPLKPEQSEEASRLPNLTVFKSEFKLEWMEDPWRDVRQAGEWLLHLERRLKPEVVHLNGYVHAALPWRASTLVVGHSCVLSWWQAVKGEAAPASWERYREEVTRGLHAARLVVAPTKAMLAALETHYGPLARARVVPNGRDAAIFAPAEKEEMILTAGRLWDEAKNVSSLARIAPRLSWPVYIAGEEKHPDGGAARFEGVRLLGRLSTEALAEEMARAAIYALPARYEPFGLSALEAALAGCALVLGDIPSLREIWGEAALFVAPDDGETLRATLASLSADRARCEEMARRARVRASEFTTERMARGYLAAYSELMTNSGGTRKAEEALACAS